MATSEFTYYSLLKGYFFVKNNRGTSLIGEIVRISN
jgi:hypothetical protein